jgi:hypothetical protein
MVDMTAEYGSTSEEFLIEEDSANQPGACRIPGRKYSEVGVLLKRS